MHKRSQKRIRMRSQLYLDAITNFIHDDSVEDPKSQAEDRLILDRLKARAKALQKSTS
jgi:hypothetical protein